MVVTNTQTSSAEPLRPASPTDRSDPEKEGIATTDHSAQSPAHNGLQVPDIAIQDASDDDRQPRPETRTSANASLNVTQPTSRAVSPNPSALFPHTQIVFDDPEFTRPPPLNYSLRPRKKAIFWFWTLIFLDCVCMPIGLYFGMWYGLTRDQLSANAVFSISTALLGTVSIVEYIIRFLRLWRKDSNCRVIGAERHYVCETLPCTSTIITNTDFTCNSLIGFTGISLLVGSLS